MNCRQFNPVTFTSKCMLRTKDIYLEHLICLFLLSATYPYVESVLWFPFPSFFYFFLGCLYSNKDSELPNSPFPFRVTANFSSCWICHPASDLSSKDFIAIPQSQNNTTFHPRTKGWIITFPYIFSTGILLALTHLNWTLVL